MGANGPRVTKGLCYAFQRAYLRPAVRVPDVVGARIINHCDQQEPKRWSTICVEKVTIAFPWGSPLPGYRWDQVHVRQRQATNCATGAPEYVVTVFVARREG